MYRLYLQEKYASLVLPQLERSKVINQTEFLACARCPICGDSKKNKTKTRFYIYRFGDTLNCKCHNCGYSKSFVGFLKQYSPAMYGSMQQESYKDTSYFSSGKQPKQEELPEPKIVSSDVWKDFIIPAKEVTIGKKFLEFRQFPKEKWDRVYITDDVARSYIDISEALGLKPQEKNYPDFPAICFPFIRPDGVLTHINYRNLDKNSSFRYITAEFNGGLKCFGLETVSDVTDVYVCEGPADSLFLDNCIAMGDASLDRAKNLVSKHRLILVPDNEPRAPVQVKKINGFIKDGFRVFIPPRYITQKDLNDMAKAGYDVQELVSGNVYEGMMARHKFFEWKKI